MRKVRFIAVVAMAAALAVSCKSQEEKETAFKAEVKAIIDLCGLNPHGRAKERED